jgi:hypothetical protein
MWWSIPISIIGVVILIAVPMILDYSAEKKEDKKVELFKQWLKEDKNNDDRNDTNN